MPDSTNRQSTCNRFPTKSPLGDASRSASERIDQKIAELKDWRGPMLAALRDVIRSAGPEIVEEWKWNTPVWSCDGIICTGEAYKAAVKLTFAKGAGLVDPDSLFNASLEGNVRRAIDFTEGASIDARALAALVREAVALNRASIKGKRGPAA